MWDKAHKVDTLSKLIKFYTKNFQSIILPDNASIYLKNLSGIITLRSSKEKRSKIKKLAKATFEAADSYQKDFISYTKIPFLILFFLRRTLTAACSKNNHGIVDL